MLWIQRHTLGEMVQGRFELLIPNIRRAGVGALDQALDNMDLSDGRMGGQEEVESGFGEIGGADANAQPEDNFLLLADRLDGLYPFE